jgi:hypothetical protein
MSDIQFTFTRRGRSHASPAEGMTVWAEELKRGMTVAANKMPTVMRSYLARIVAALSAKHGGKWPSTTATSLSSRSGSLLSQLQAGIKVAGSGFSSTRGTLSGPEYLRLHEYGGTLRSRAKYLAIPLPAALKSDGTPLRDNPRDWDNTFVQMSRAGNLLIFRRIGAGIEPLYALKTQVAIPARFGARQTARDQMPYFTRKVLDAVLAEFKV